MSRIFFVRGDGARNSVDAADGDTVMMIAVQGGVKGIDGECGGCCSCATCHVYVDEAFMEKLPTPKPLEQELLSGVAAELRSTSRLSCQLIVTPELDGLVVHIPERQS